MILQKGTQTIEIHIAIKNSILNIRVENNVLSMRSTLAGIEGFYPLTLCLAYPYAWIRDAACM
jgi:hypothetical protein